MSLQSSHLINSNSDGLRPVVSLVEELTGRRPSPSSVWRWCAKGTKRAGKLPALRVLNTWHTTSEALLGWLATESTAPGQTDGHQSSSRSVETEERLRTAGLL